MTAMLEARIRVDRPTLSVQATLTVDEGETLAVMGPSGAGKSTLLDAIAGLVRLDDGEVRLGGRTLADAGIHTPPHRRGVGMLRQRAELFAHLSVADNIAFAARIAGASDPRAVAQEWLERIGLADFGDRRPETLSGGQAQRVALARALAARPRVLLMDEPLSSLDVQAAEELRAVLAEVLTERTVVMVSHQLADARPLADRLLILVDGRVMQCAGVDEVLARPQGDFAEAVARSQR